MRRFGRLLRSPDLGPPVSEKRLFLTPRGDIGYSLKAPYRDGTTHVIFEPLDFIARLACLCAARRQVIERILRHLDSKNLPGLWPESRAPPVQPATSISRSSTNEDYQARMDEACAAMKSQGITHVVFGDLYLEDVRQYREDQLGRFGIKGILPLWQRETTSLAAEMIESGLVAHLTCVDPGKLDRRFAGRRFDKTLLEDLPAEVDPCSENGEFHTVVSAGPMFARPIAAEVGEVVERDGFIFADVN